jgi:hypothetical protein
MLTFIKIASADTVVKVGKGVPKDAQGLLNALVANIVNPMITLLLALAVLYFIYGVFEFVRNADSPEDRKKGGMHILWATIGIFIMISAYGIISLVKGTIGAD